MSSQPLTRLAAIPIPVKLQQVSKLADNTAQLSVASSEFQPQAASAAFQPSVPSFTPSTKKAFEPTAPAFKPKHTSTFAGTNPGSAVFQPSVQSPEFTPSVPSATQSVFKPSASAFVPGNGAAEFVPSATKAPVFVPGGNGSLAVPDFYPEEDVSGGEYYEEGAEQDWGPQRAAVTSRQFAEPVPRPIQRFAGPPPITTFPSMLPHVHAKDDAAAVASYFMAESMRTELMRRQFAVQMQLEHPEPHVPIEADNYHSLYPVEQMSLADGKVFGYPSIIYKAIHKGMGLPFAMRRIIGFKLSDAAAMARVDLWKKVKHPNVIRLKEVFTTKDFNDHSLVFVHHFHPLSETLLHKHFSGGSGYLPEQLLWSYLIQLTGALRSIHNGGLACRVIEPSKILVSGRGNLLISSTGVFDVMQYESAQVTPQAISHFQQEDLLMLGKLILALACKTMAAVAREVISMSVAQVQQNYSEDLFNVIRYLLHPAPPQRLKSLNDLMPYIGARFYTEIDNQNRLLSAMEGELGKELQNGRLMRLMTKLEFVVDRPEQANDARWSDTGDRFLLKLLRSYIFHQVSEETGKAWTDLPHVVQTLNKLDAGVDEKCLLVTPDEKNVMIVTYANLKLCLSRAFEDLQSTIVE